MTTDKQQVFFRAVPAVLEQRDDHMLTGRLVPYDTVANVLDDRGPGVAPDIYQEGFRRGAFDGQVNNARTNKGVLTRIGFIHRHDGGLGYLGPFVGLRDEPDGLWGDVSILPTKAEDVGALLRNGIDELSIEFRLRPGQNTIEEGGVRWRTLAHLDQVALEPKGAYSSAQVLAYREEMDELEQEHRQSEAAAQAIKDAEAEEAVALEAIVAEAAERKARWDALAGRTDDEVARQRALIEQYGVTQPSGFGSLR
jgi:HK97 family phage prohead protease